MIRPTMMVALGITSIAAAQTAPSARIPRTMADALIRGNTRVVVVGDSISNNYFGQPVVQHTPLVVGMQRQWRPHRWHGIYCPVAQSAPGGYQTWRGVGCSAYVQPDCTSASLSMDVETAWPAGTTGFGTESSLETSFPDGNAIVDWYGRATYRLFSPSSGNGNPATQQLLSSPALTVRHLVYTDPAVQVPASMHMLAQGSSGFAALSPALAIPNVRRGWSTVDFEVGPLLVPPFDRLHHSLYVETRIDRQDAEDLTYITQGVLFFDPAPGLQIHSVAQGGWNNDDHLRMSAPGHGYSDEGLREELAALGFADAGVDAAVVMIATGTNIAGGESTSGLSTPVFDANVTAIMGRYQAALAAIGAPAPQFLLVNMYSWGLPPDSFGASRAQRLWGLVQGSPEIGYIDLRALGGTRGGAFDPAWYFNQTQSSTTAACATGDNTLSVASLAGFPESGGYVIVDGAVSAGGGYASLDHTASTLLGVNGLSHNFPAGSHVLSLNVADLHLSMLGSDTLAARMWGAIAAASSFCSADFNGDGDTGTDLDIEAFFACLGGACCPSCGVADFNGDGDVGTDADIESFFRVLGGGAC